MSVDISKTYLYWGACRSGGKEYKSYSLARSFRKDGKVRKEIVMKLGKLSDKQAHEWRLLLKTMKGKNSDLVPINDVVTEANYAYLDVAVLLETWHFWGLSTAFKDDSQRQIPLWAVVATLVINRCVDPSSKSQVSTWFQGTSLPYILDIEPSQMNSSRIFRELSVIDSLKPEICDYLYNEVTKRDPVSMESVFYDLSSSTFSGTRCVLMDWGFCKEGFDNHVVLALLVNKKGLPVYWEVLPGCTADVTTIELLMRNLKGRFNTITTTMVFDRGMVSDANLNLLEQSQTKYISAMDRNQLVKFSDIKFTDYSGVTSKEIEKNLLTSGIFIKLNETTYYHEVKFNEGGLRRYILCFNPQLCDDQRRAREDALFRFRSVVRGVNKELLNAKNSRDEKSTRNKFDNEMSIEQKGYLKIVLKKKKLSYENDKCKTVTVNTYQGTVEVDETKFQTAGQMDGFWMIVTNHTEQNADKVFSISAEDVISPYKEKVVIESAFRDIKSFLEISPIHVWTIEHVKAHYTICVLAYLLDRTLTLRLHEKPGNCSSDVVAHEKLYKELKKCLVNRTSVAGVKAETLGLTRPTKNQQELLERIGLTHLLQKGFVNKCFAKGGV
jgi:transposase